ncbi:general stress protein [Patulibacter sp. SYSU D01012]|uniref:general stress protein n=1 Tax=Patulibacter sp. SYSU D01012 TaxID=2817381 RepID=UPI001B304CC6|nr:general stress protein [Patulibacter sp. SYSU D01012]
MSTDQDPTDPTAPAGRSPTAGDGAGPPAGDAGRPAAPPDAGGPPAAPGGRTTVGTYDDYADAVRAVDWLSDEGFPVERAAIVGTGLRTVEQITGRVTTGGAAGQGAAQGAVIGLVFALLFGIFFTGPGFLGLLLYAVLLAALLGAALAAIAHAATGGTRDFGSVGGMTAERYEVVVDHDVAARATELLSRAPAR